VDAVLEALAKANLGDRTIHEVPKSRQAAFEHGPRAAADADISGVEHLERNGRCVHKGSNLMHEKPEALAIAWGADVRARALSSILRDRARDGVVEAPVCQRIKVPQTGVR